MKHRDSLSDTSPIAFHGYRGGDGGIAQVMINLMNGIAGMGQPVDLLLNGFAPPELERIHPEIRVIDLNRTRLPGNICRLAWYLLRERPAAILSNRERANRRAIIARALSRARARLVVRVGTHNTTSLQQRNTIQRPLRRLALRFSYRHSDSVVAVSREVAEDISVLSGVTSDRIHVINNPTIPADIKDKMAEPVAHPWFQPGEPPVIVSVGRLVRIKDYPTLLRAFARLHQSREARLVLFGDGGKRDELLTLAAELRIAQNVDLPGFVSNPFAYLSRAALFVLCSLREGSPNALIEALACGIPVVATDCPSGPREILDNGRYGPLVPVGSSDRLAEAMLEMLSHPPDARVLQTAVRSYRADIGATHYLKAILDRAKD